MERIKVATEVWNVLFPLRVGDKVRFLGLNRRWQVGHIKEIYGESIEEGYFVIEIRKQREIYHVHLELKIGNEIEIWRKLK